MKHQRVALALLVVGLACSYTWYWADGPHDADWWNIAGAVQASFMLVIIGMVFRSPEVWAVVALLTAFKAMVIGCNVWYVLAPWPMQAGQALCSTRLNIPLGALGAGIGALLAAKILRGSQ